MEQIVKVNTDGGARGNPGPGAGAFVVETDGKIIHKDSGYLGKVTNNTAEYAAVLMALNWLNKNQKIFEEKKIIFYLDSELIVRQINGIYKVRDENLKKLNIQILILLKNFRQKIFFKNIPRSENKMADFLVNQRLDASV